MAGSQQSPKKDKGTRNSNRSNGKAATKKQYGDYGQILTGKGKPSGKSFCGVSLARIETMARTQGRSVEGIKGDLLKKRDEKKATRKKRGVGYKARLADRTVNGG